MERAAGGERIVLTSRGRPKALLISVADAEALDEQGEERAVAADTRVFDEIERFVEHVRRRRKGVPLPPSIDDIYAIREDSLAKYE